MPYSYIGTVVYSLYYYIKPLALRKDIGREMIPVDVLLLYECESWGQSIKIQRLVTFSSRLFPERLLAPPPGISI